MLSIFPLLCVAALLGPAACRVVPIKRLPVHKVTKPRFARALAAGELLVIEGGAAAWPATSEWSLEWFEARFPGAAVEFRMAGSLDSDVVAAAGVGLTLGNYRAVAGELSRPYYVGWGNQDEAASRVHFQPYLQTPAYFPSTYSKQGFKTEWLYFGSKDSGVPWHTDPQ